MLFKWQITGAEPAFFHDEVASASDKVHLDEKAYSENHPSLPLLRLSVHLLTPKQLKPQ